MYIEYWKYQFESNDIVGTTIKDYNNISSIGFILYIRHVDMTDNSQPHLPRYFKYDRQLIFLAVYKL